MLANSLIELDRAHLIHLLRPLTARHEGAEIRLRCHGNEANGHELAEGFAGLWRVNAGYGHRSLDGKQAR